jgi:hypothetical protein
MPESSCCHVLIDSLGGDVNHYSSTKTVHKEQKKELRMDHLKGKKAYCFAHLENIIPVEAKKRADSMVRICEDGRTYFVELKGNGIPVREATKQVIAGIDFAKERNLAMDCIGLYGVIVGSRMPGTAAWNKIRTDFRRKYGRDLIRTQKYYSIPLNH